ncbi:MDR family NADP-dependent oxidoreductase (plasmid) [Streptomyces sp. BI20]|uniref:MDR family NADP-dependent oxidoreductase n=1 Tax=Streptomyces sp. BI20 TaxID=3403460 RepID=UPI003C711067
MPTAPSRHALPRTAREVRLRAVPEGLPRREHFALVDVPLPTPGPGQVLVRNRFFLVSPGLRTLLGGGVPGTPLPGVHPGDPLFGPAVGEVVAAPTGGPLPLGRTVVHLHGWREYALVPVADCVPTDGALPDPAAYLSHGSAAYGALSRIARVRPGDVVFVTGAAGAVGSMAGPVARLSGAAKVIGSTGSPAKAARLRDELGYDAVVIRGAGPIADQLARVAPEGVDVLVDTVGGEQLTAAVDAARPGARFALVGALAGQLAADRDGGSAPAGVDVLRLVLSGVSLRGYRGADHPEVDAEWTAWFGDRLRAGRIGFPHVRIPGMERAPRALEETIAGRHFGAVVVAV